MNIEDYLKDELKRLNRMNDLLEKKINKGEAVKNEPEQILNNVSVMCNIVNMLAM